jgi:hypothetical protein
MVKVEPVNRIRYPQQATEAEASRSLKMTDGIGPEAGAGGQSDAIGQSYQS